MTMYAGSTPVRSSRQKVVEVKRDGGPPRRRPVSVIVDLSNRGPMAVSKADREPAGWQLAHATNSAGNGRSCPTMVPCNGVSPKNIRCPADPETSPALRNAYVVIAKIRPTSTSTRENGAKPVDTATKRIRPRLHPMWIIYPTLGVPF